MTKAKLLVEDDYFRKHTSGDGAVTACTIVQLGYNDLRMGYRYVEYS
jgi:hypothetical protein